MNHNIRELASRPVISVEADTLVVDALKLMSARRISCLVVLLNDEPVGILTERDVVFAANWVIGQPSLRVREVMSKPVLTASANLTVSQVYQLFRSHNIRHLVLLGERMEMDGVFTQTDLVRALGGMVFSGTRDVTALMSSRVRCVNPAETARQALALMASHAISGMIVVDNERPVGVFTERDAVRLVAAGVDLTNLPVGTVMTAPVVTIPEGTTPGRAIELMRGHEVRRLLVVNEEDRLVGILTQTDLSRVLEAQEEKLLGPLVNTVAGTGSNAYPAIN